MKDIMAKSKTNEWSQNEDGTLAIAGQTLFAEEYHQNYMWAGVMGNHDYMDKSNSKNRNDFFRSVYAFPTNGYEGEEGVCYYFKYSNCLFITMNNETQTTDAAVKKAQDWFEEVENFEKEIIANQAPLDFDVSVKDIYSSIRRLNLLQPPFLL